MVIFKTRLNSLQLMRGLAATLVVMHHAGNMTKQTRFFGQPVWNDHLSNFNVGIDFFFVLSGFIITWVHWKDIGHKEQFTNFYKKRVARIFPLYWIILIPLIMLYLFIPGSGNSSQRDITNIFLSVFLIPNYQHPILGVAWTLTFELFFYAIFSIFILYGKKCLLILPLWAGSIVAIQMTAWADAFPFSFVFSPLNLEFIAGMGIAIWLKEHNLSSPRILLMTSLSIFLGALFFATNIQDINIVGRSVFGLSSAGIIASLVQIERDNQFETPKIFVLFGSASYALYLVHPLVLSALYNSSYKLNLFLTQFPELFLVTACFTSILIGIFVHLAVEVPVLDKVRKYFDV